jgi:poly(3-hydroxyalkanoate) synthetase
VYKAQVDDKTRLQHRFYARQFIDAMSPSNFPATNPEVICKAIETRSVSLTDGMKNLIDDLQKGRITRREDHIVPWKSAFRSKDLVSGEAHFVLAASGHVAGVINPPDPEQAKPLDQQPFGVRSANVV